MPTLNDIRSAGEAKLQKLLAVADSRQCEIIRNAIKRYGRVQDVPEDTWIELRRMIEEDEALAAALLLLIASSDEWVVAEVNRQGFSASGRSLLDEAGYAIQAARRTRAMADTIDTVRSRLSRKVADSQLDISHGDVGELTDSGIDAALDDVFTKARIEGLATDATTQAITYGQRAARDRIEAGGDGASLEPLGGGTATPTQLGQQVTIDLIWRTERDDRVCPRCSPLEGTNEETWGKIFPEGPGPEAHPNCRCELEPRVIVEMPTGDASDN